MAVQLPKYQRQVGAASGAGVTQMVDPNAAVAPVRAMGKAIDATTNMGMEFAQRLQKHKVEGESAQYASDLKKQLPQMINNAKDQGKLDGISDEDMFEKAIKPVIDGFYEAQTGKGYSKKVTDIIASDYENQHDQQLLLQQGEVLDNTIIRSNIAKTELATELGASDSPEDVAKSKVIWDDLQTTMKPAAYADARSMAVTKPAQTEIQELNRAVTIGEIEDEEYFNGLSKIKDKVKSADNVLFKHSHQIELEVNSKQNAYIKGRVRGAQEEAKNFNTQITKKVVTTADYERVRKAMGDNWADGVEFATQTGELMRTVSDTDSRTAIKNLSALFAGEKNLNEFIRENSKIGGVVGATTLLAASDMLQELTATQGEFSAYEWWFGKVGGKDKKVKLDTNTTDFLNRVGQYMDITPGNTSEHINTSLSSFAKWKADNPDATNKEYQEFASDYFKPIAMKAASQATAPQQSAPKYKDGDTRTHPTTGITYTMKDGKWLK